MYEWKVYRPTSSTTDQENGIAERHKETLVQQRMSAMLTILFSATKEQLSIHFKQVTTAFEAVCNQSINHLFAQSSYMNK